LIQDDFILNLHMIEYINVNMIEFTN